MSKKTCFVVMGFGEKVDLATGRTLNLNASYFNVIKPTVEAAGLECVRADEIVNSGNINVPMYERILTSDLVIADLSTSNNNAFYELGVRHALRPYSTIIIAESKFTFPFDIAQITVRKYEHLGPDIGYGEVMRFRADLENAITTLMSNPTDDSPVYTFLTGLRRLDLATDYTQRAGGAAAAPAPAETHSALMQQAAAAKADGDFETAKLILEAVRSRMKKSGLVDPYVLQQLALATYKRSKPTKREDLEEARAILLELQPETSNDTETLGIWGATHKRLWEVTGERAALDEAVRAYERGFYLRNDYYNGINLAFLLNVRADEWSKSTTRQARAEAIADFIQAERVRRAVIDICKAWIAANPERAEDDAAYWVKATLGEAHLGIGDSQEGARWLADAYAMCTKPDDWRPGSTKEQLAKLLPLLERSPLNHVPPPA